MAVDSNEKVDGNLDEHPEEEITEGGSEVSKTVLIIIIAAFGLFLAVAGAGFYILWQKIPVSSAPVVEASKSAPEKEQSASTMGPVYSVNPFVINLAGSAGKRFLRVKIDLELKDQATFEQVRLQFPRVKDKLLTILTAKTFEDVNTVEGKNDLRVEIAAAVDTLFWRGAVSNVYLTDFVVE